MPNLWAEVQQLRQQMRVPAGGEQQIGVEIAQQAGQVPQARPPPAGGNGITVRSAA